MDRSHCIDLILKERGTEQQWLARRLDISDAYLSRLLSGERPWTEALKDKVAESLMLPRAVLFFEAECRCRLQQSQETPTEPEPEEG
jgi:transcriptional regulator with XRE-family HTH domain